MTATSVLPPNMPASNGAATAIGPTAAIAVDSTGNALLPDSMSHTYGYTNGVLTSDTATDGTNTWVKTFTYTGTQLTAESKWVKQ